MRKQILGIVGKHVIMLLAGTAAGILLLCLAYCLPVEPMRVHVYQSLPMLEREFGMENLIDEFPGTFVGSFTDCLMLENAVYQSEEHSMLEQILCMYRAESGTEIGWAPGHSLVDYLEYRPQPVEVAYSRYWHGYLVVLKPFLLLTTFTSIRLIAAWVQLLLMGGAFLACSRKGGKFLGAAFLVSVPFLYYFSLFASLSLSICYYILTAALLVQLKWGDRIADRGWYGEFFLLTGMVTSYFDFLTYPLVTLGFPLCAYLFMSRGRWLDQFRRMVVCSVEWGIGYTGLWAMKWIVAEIFTGEKVIADGLQALLERTDTMEDGSMISGYPAVLWGNMEMFANWSFGLLAAGIILWLCSCIVRHRRRITRESILNSAVIFLVALYPFAWFFFTQNHSAEHALFTCKILSVTVFAGVCAVGKLCSGEVRNREADP